MSRTFVPMGKHADVERISRKLHREAFHFLLMQVNSLLPTCAAVVESCLDRDELAHRG